MVKKTVWSPPKGGMTEREREELLGGLGAKYAAAMRYAEPAARSCRFCGRKLLEKTSACLGSVEIKCPRCGQINRLNLYYRRAD